jgi:anti-repressor protein
MTELSIFRYDGADVRTVVIDDEPWFAANDVARVLGYVNPADAIARHTRGVAKRYPLLTAGGVQEIRVIAEADLLRLIIASRLPEAQAFERWVFETVLPEIRRTGSFTAPAAAPALTDDEIVHRALAITHQRVQALEAKVAEDAPKVDAYDQLMDADGYYSMESAAKMCGVGRNTLYRRLREAGVIQPGSTLPYQKYMHHFTLTASSWTDGDGNVHPTQTTRVRPAGLPFLMRKMQNEEVTA